MEDPGVGEPPGRSGRAEIGRFAGPWALATGLVFLAAAALVFGELFLAHDPARVSVTDLPKADNPPHMRRTSLADVTYEAWLVARHAATLPTAPHRLFDTPHCAPTERSLTLGIPMVAMGVLGIPAALVSDEPVWIYNVSLVALCLFSALAMYALVLQWTGVPAAAIAAGLWFGFQPMRLGDISHPSVWDASGTVLALWFAERLFRTGRWRDVLGFSLAVAFQVGASFYPLLAATFLCPAFLVWLFLREGPRAVSGLQLGVAGLAAVLSAALLLGPYLLAETVDGRLQRDRFAFAPPYAYGFGHGLFPGVTLLAAAVWGCTSRRLRDALRIPGDPRLALVLGGSLVALVAAGAELRLMAARWLPADLAQLVPDFYAALAAVVPGMDAVRVVFRLSQGVHLALTILAGLGLADLLRRCGRGRIGNAAAVAVVLCVGLDVVRAPALGLPRPYAWEYRVVASDPERREFFEELEELGNAGPVLELPLDVGLGQFLAPPRILATTRGGRRTSACFGSYPAPGRRALNRTATRLPEPEAIREIADLGFTTIVIHYADAGYRWGLLEQAAIDGRGLGVVLRAPERVAIELRPATLEAP